ncbi:MAG: ABC transporter substrate-binding protein [Paracoccaceae bacterium]|nr:ABC transporter substrate-binding protein [Paracoccaceae bacterium]
MPKPVLRTVTRSQGNNRALKEGRVGLPDFELAFEEVEPLVKGFRRMVRELAYDVSEMALTTYLCAKAHGVRFTALPVFLVRDFHHGAIQVNRGAGLRTGKDFEGRRVGVNRGYTVTTGVWARAILEEEYGTDLSQVTWVRSGEEHVAEFVPPPNVVPLEEGHDLAADLASDVLPAAVGAAVDHPEVVPFVENPFAAGVAALKGRGLYPINHLVVVKDEVLAAHPGLAAQLFEAFAASKRLYVEELRAGRIAEPKRADKVALAALEVMDDPLPYGIEPNRKVLETLMGHAVTQGIIPAQMDIERLFAEEVRGLVG